MTEPIDFSKIGEPPPGTHHLRVGSVDPSLTAESVFKAYDIPVVRVVGITGYAQHGKDTVGQVLVNEFGFTRFAFADPLKSMALALNPFIHDPEMGPSDNRLARLVRDCGWEVAKTNPEVRRFLQVLGTEAVRDHLGQDSWVEATRRAIVASGVDKAVVTDARFPNEFAWVKAVGELWKVARYNEDGSPFDNGIGIGHPSEAHIDSAPTDFVLRASNIEELRAAARGYAVARRVGPRCSFHQEPPKT